LQIKKSAEMLLAPAAAGKNIKPVVCVNNFRKVSQNV